MATRILSWSGDDHIVSPNLSKTPSVISVGSILSDKPEASEPQPTHTPSKVVEPNGTRTSTLTSTTLYPPGTDGSFMRHNKYFFNDGNVTFLVDNVLYCVHRYFFSRDSTYFSTRFTQLDIRDHEPLPTIISLGDIERKDFDAFLSILYPEDFEGNQFSYEEWKSVLHLSTRWDFASIRRLALGSIEPPTPHDRLLLARTYSVDDWVVPALSALCERTTPLSLSEARQMSIEDVVLVSTVREDIRSHALQVDSAEIPLRVEAEQLGALGVEIPVHLRVSTREASPTVALKRESAHEGDDEHSAEEGASGNTSVLKGELTQFMKNREVASSRSVETGKDSEALRINNIGIQRGDPEEVDNGAAICTSTPNSKPAAIPTDEKLAGVPPGTSRPGSPAPPVLPSYPVGRGISLPFGQLLPTCDWCSCNALIAWSRTTAEGSGVLCLDHGLEKNSATRDLVLKPRLLDILFAHYQCRFISAEHEAAIRAFLALPWCGS